MPTLEFFLVIPTLLLTHHYICSCYHTGSRLIQKASDEIMSSSRLRRVLGVILHLGNKINNAGPGTSKASAAAIRLQSLVNLGNAKAIDRKTSFLHYTATILRQSNPDLIQFNDDLPNLRRAAKVNWAELQKEVECLEVSVSNIRELALNAPFADNRVATRLLSPDEEIGVLQSTSVGRFTLEACIQMAVVYHEVEACKQSLEALFAYFGERHAERSYSGVAGPETVFHALALFAKNFESAVEQSAAREKERSIRDCRTTASVIISCNRTHGDKAPQRATGPLEQIRDILGAIRCKTMSVEE
jgi:Formin Homology 2 Domain